MKNTLRSRAGRLSLLAVAATMMAGVLAPLGTQPAHAGSKGRRNTTIGLGAVTAYGLLKRNKKVAIAGGVGTIIAYDQYRKAKRREERRDRYRNARRARERRYSSYRTRRYRYSR